MDLAALAVELAKPAYLAMDDEAAANAVMAARLTPERMVPSAEVARLWALRGVLAAAREAGNRAATPAARQLGWRALDIVEKDVLGELDTRNPADRTEFSNLLDALVTANIMTAGDRTATLALVTKQRTGREVFGLVLPVDVTNARTLI